MIAKLSKITIILLLALCTACCPCRFNRRNAAPLNGTVWHLVQLAGRDMVFDGGEFEMSFGTDGRLTGFGACNGFSADYTATSKGVLDISLINSTRVYCPNSSVEQQLFTELDNATHYEIDGQIMLLLQNGEIRAIFSAVKEVK